MIELEKQCNMVRYLWEGSGQLPQQSHCLYQVYHQFLSSVHQLLFSLIAQLQGSLNAVLRSPLFSIHTLTPDALSHTLCLQRMLRTTQTSLLILPSTLDC